MDEIFVAGGSTQLPLVQEQICQYFGKPVVCQFNPMHAIGIGASIASQDDLATS